MAVGIYIVSIKNKELMPVDTDKRKIGKVMLANHLNCKVGKAHNLEQREKNYIKTFGEENVVFEVLKVLESTEGLRELENKIKLALKNYRKRSLFNRATEWLENIEPEKAKEILNSVL